MVRKQLQYERQTRPPWRLFGAATLLLGLLAAGYLFLPPYLSGSSAGETLQPKQLRADLMLDADSRRSSMPSRPPYFQEASATYMNRLTPLHFSPQGPFSREKTLEFVKHEVQKGEGLWLIAQMYNRRTYTIRSVNERRLRPYDYLPRGITLRIPNRDGIMVRLHRGQTLWDVTQAYNVSSRRILRFNRIQSARNMHVGQELFVPGAQPRKRVIPRGTRGRFGWPVPPGLQRVTSPFGMRNHPIHDRKIPHQGIDIGGHRGARVLASHAGRVTFARRWSTYGNTILIKHYNGFKTLYSHLSQIRVKHGEYVERGQVIGSMGSTGLATGANLHFEIRQKGSPVNPLKLLP